MLCVGLIILEAACEAARSDQELAEPRVVTMRLFAGKGFAGDFLQQTFANADARNREGA